MAMIETADYGKVHEHLVGDMPVFGRLAIELDEQEGATPETFEQRRELACHAALLSGKVVAEDTLQQAGLRGDLAGVGIPAETFAA